MTKKTINILFACTIASVAAGAVFQQKEKSYPVNHTRNEWGAKQQGSLIIQRIARYSCLPPESRYIIDSICDSHVDDIQKQVVAAMVADTVKSKKP